MAQPIRCDWEPCGELADMILSNLHDGDTLAYCGTHIFDWAATMVAQVPAIAAGQAPSADLGPANVVAETEAETNATDAAAAALLDHPTASPGSSGGARRAGRERSGLAVVENAGPPDPEVDGEASQAT